MIEKRPFGRTDHRSTRAIFGAAAFWAVTQYEADTAMEQVLAYGVNHVDVASSYNLAEERLGDWIRRHGRPFFLATKTDGRTAAGAREELLRSLERLHVDSIDLWQMHNLSDPQEWETALGPGGALEAAIEAKREGLIRYIGITGHELCAPMLQLRALERFDFDSVMFPYSYVLALNTQYRAAVERLLEVCRARKTAVQSIKVIARSPLVEGDPNPYNTWYRPIDDPSEIDLAVHWVLQHENCFLPTPADLQIFPKVLDAVARFESAPSDEQMREQVRRLGMEPIFNSGGKIF
ncbi:MAG TPA: aldo/keto reductase [Bacillota bacterium]|nr:aldo/keto reductase [Bacillota bacterium]